jgi:hypothetical protein
LSFTWLASAFLLLVLVLVLLFLLFLFLLLLLLPLPIGLNGDKKKVVLASLAVDSSSSIWRPENAAVAPDCDNIGRIECKLNFLKAKSNLVPFLSSNRPPVRPPNQSVSQSAIVSRFPFYPRERRILKRVFSILLFLLLLLLLLSLDTRQEITFRLLKN